jgi:hypothetical protein
MQWSPHSVYMNDKKGAIMKTIHLFFLVIFVLLSTSGYCQYIAHTYASGLPGAVGIQIDGRGWIWVAQIGSGHADSKISVVTGEDKVYPFMTGLPSEISPTGDIVGAAHVFFRPDGKLLIMQGGPGTDSLSQSVLLVDTAGFIPGVSSPLDRSAIDSIYRVGKFLYGIGDTLSNPYTLAFGPNNDMYIVDAAANAIVKRDNSSGDFSIFATFPNIPNTTGIGGPTSEVVPTGIVYKGGKFFVGSLTGFPFANDASTLYEIDTAGSVSSYKDGLTTIVDVTTDSNDSPAVLQHATFQPPPTPFAPNSGAVLRINSGSIDTIFNGLDRPTSVRFKSGGELYVSTLTAGTIIQIVKAEILTKHLQLWLKADAGVVLNGSKVTRWLDQSGNGNTAFESDTSRQPVLANNELHGKPVLRFDGVNDRLGFTGSKQMTQISLFMVINNKSGGSGPNPPGFVLTFGPGGPYVANEHLAIKMRGLDDGDNDIIVGTEDHNDYIKATGQGIAAYDEWRSLSITRNKTLWNTTLRWNGIDAPISTSGSDLSVSIPLGDSTASGGGIGSTDNFPDLGRVLAKCDIAEIAVYDTVLSDSDRISIERYLGNKYGMTMTGVVASQSKDITQRFRLQQNYPNPFNPTTTITYELPRTSHVSLTVYDMLGREVSVLVNEKKEAGVHEVEFNGSALASGVYLYRLTTGAFTQTRKMIVVK